MKMMHNLVFGDSGETCQEKMKHHNRGELVLLGNETIQIYGIDRGRHYEIGLLDETNWLEHIAEKRWCTELLITRLASACRAYSQIHAHDRGVNPNPWTREHEERALEILSNRDNPLDGMAIEDTVNHMMGDILQHYFHACEKHPHFADMHTSTTAEIAEGRAFFMKAYNMFDAKKGKVAADRVVAAEFFEYQEAVARGDMEHAREEALDTIAALMRVIDVIDGHAKFGDPEKKGE